MNRFFTTACQNAKPRGVGQAFQPDTRARQAGKPDLLNTAAGSFLLMRAVLIGTLLVAAAQGQTPVKRAIKETLLADFPADPAIRDTAVLSPSAAHVAYLATAGGQSVVVLDDKKQKPYDKVAALTFSDDGRLAYVASKGGKWLMVVADQEQGPYEKVGPPVFSPDGKRLAYVAMLADQKRAVVIDGKPGTAFDEIFDGLLVHSPDSQRLAYGGRKGKEWFVVIDGKESGPFEYLGSATGILFSKDSRHIAFAALEKGKFRLMLDGKPREPFENLAEAALSADGSHWAVAAFQEGKWRVIVDGKPQAAYDEINEGSLQFSPDGGHVAYGARDGRRWMPVLDGKPCPDPVGVSVLGFAEKNAEIKFSPNSRLLAYVARVEVAFESDGRKFTEQGEAVLTADVGTPTPSKTAKPKEKPAETGPRAFQRIGGGTLVFNVGGQRLAYVARNKARDRESSFVVADGKRKPRYDLVGYLTFAPDGRRPVYAATRGNKAFTVVDEKESAVQFDEIWMPPGQPLLFVSPTRFRYLGIRGGKIFSVEESLE